MKQVDEVSIRRYGSGDKGVLEKTLGDPSQMIHLNGPESEEKLVKRHQLFLKMSIDSSAGCMFTITIDNGAMSVGNVGYWDKDWKGEKAWETGWFVVPEFQRRGIATEAMKRMIYQVAELNKRYMFAYPSITNAPSNAMCKKLGFTFIEETELEYPPSSGLRLRCNVWRLDLSTFKDHQSTGTG